MSGNAFASVRLARGLRMALALLALFAVTTGQVGSCARERPRPTVTLDSLLTPEGLKRPASRLTSIGRWAPGDGLVTRVSVSPSPARIGTALRYLAVVRAGRDQKVQFQPPQSGGAFTWSNLRAGRARAAWWKQSAYEAADSVWFEARLQVFETGLVAIPGPLVSVEPLPRSWKPGPLRMPTAHVVIAPTVTAADSNQTLRGFHGPIGAPWWERVPIVAIAVGAVLLAAWLIVLRKLRRRVRKPARRPSAPVAAPVKPRLDPAAEALRALFTLRAQKLPEQQRFGEHALALTAILRRFLEATVTTPRPGDTSIELLERLRASRLHADELVRLEGLLGLWDRVKFARAPLTETEARGCEQAVEAYVRRVAQARLEAEAAVARAAAARAASAAAKGGHGGPPPPPAAGASSGSASGATSRPSATPASGSVRGPASGASSRPASGSTSRPSSGSMSRPGSDSGPRPVTRSGGRPPAPEAA